MTKQFYIGKDGYGYNRKILLRKIRTEDGAHFLKIAAEVDPGQWIRFPHGGEPLTYPQRIPKFKKISESKAIAISLRAREKESWRDLI